MFITLRFVFALIVALLAIYGLLTENYLYQPFMLFFLSLTMLVTGIDECKKERKLLGWFMFFVFLFTFYVSIELFLSK